MFIKNNKPFSSDTAVDKIGGFEYQNLTNKDGFYVVYNLPGSDAQDTGKYTHFFTARHPMEIMYVSLATAVAETGGAVEIGVEILQEGIAPGSGDAVLVTDFDATDTANTPQSKIARALTENVRLQEGVRMGLTLTGAPTDLESVQVTIYCQNTNRGSYY